jgi:hypothetical protein
LAGAVCLASQVAVTAVTPAPLFRYIAGILFSAMLLIPMLALAGGPRDPAPEVSDSSSTDGRAAVETPGDAQLTDPGARDGEPRPGPRPATERMPAGRRTVPGDPPASLS